MRHANSTLLALVLAGFATDNARSQVREFVFVDLAAIDREAIVVRTHANDPPVVREAPSTAAVGSEPIVDDTLARPIARLGLDAEGLIRAPIAPLERSDRTGATLLEFQMGGLPIRMAVIEINSDASFDAVHYTLVDPDPDSDDYGRLTVSRVGPEIVGTFVIGLNEFRILPDDDDQIVYPVVRRAGQFRRELLPDLGTRAGRLEARHLQLAWAASNLPWSSFATQSDGRLRSYSSERSIGVLAWWDGVSIDNAGVVHTDEERLAAEIERFIDATRHRILIDERIDVGIRGADLDALARGAATTSGISFYQIIDGIPVNQDLTVSINQGGGVLAYSGTLIRPSGVERNDGTWVTPELGRVIAENAIRFRWQPQWDVILDTAELIYLVRDATTAYPSWRMSYVTGCNLGYRLDVDPITHQAGEVQEILTTNASGANRFAERQVCASPSRN